MRRELAGLRLLVTGASLGIGRAIAAHAARRGVRVIAAARNRDLLVQLQDEVKVGGHALEIVPADVATAEGR